MNYGEEKYNLGCEGLEVTSDSRLVTYVHQWCLIPFSYPRELKATPKPQTRLGK